MVNTWKNIKKKDKSFWKQYKDFKKKILNSYYSFNLIEEFGPWGIYFDKYHKLYSVGLYWIWLYHFFKSKVSAKRFINIHYNYTIKDLQSEKLDLFDFND